MTGLRPASLQPGDEDPSARQSPQRDEEQKQQTAQLRQERPHCYRRWTQSARGTAPTAAQCWQSTASSRDRRGADAVRRTDIAESFAESFALFKADPAALRRVNPEVYLLVCPGGTSKRSPMCSAKVLLRSAAGPANRELPSRSRAEGHEVLPGVLHV